LKEISSVRSSKDILRIIEDNLEASIEFIRLNCKERVATSGIQLTGMLLNLIEAQLKTEDDPKATTRDSQKMNALLVWCFVWSIGANITDATRYFMNYPIISTVYM
jgi:hypothetical protein